MLTYNYKRMFHPRLGRFVYKHKGSGLIVDNIFQTDEKDYEESFEYSYETSR